MARKAVGLIVAYPSVVTGIREPGNADNPVNSVPPTATAAALAAVQADVATLVGQGATPLEATVTTLDGHLTTLNEAWAELLGGLGAIPTASDVLISYDVDAVGTRSVLIEGIRQLMDCAAANSGLPS